MNEKIAKIKEVFADQAFVTELFDAENEQEVQKKLADRGLEMSLTEIELMGEMISNLADGKITEEQLEKLTKGGELSEEELEAAAGGGKGVEEILRTASGSSFESISSAGTVVENAAKSGSSVGWIIAGVATAVIAAGGIAQACGVDVVGGIKTGYNWCKEKITSRW